MTPNNELSPLQLAILRALPLDEPFTPKLLPHRAPHISRAMVRLEARGLVRRIRRNGRTVRVEAVDTLP